MKKGLGRGFDSLIPTNLFDEAFDPTAGQDATMSQLRQLPTADIIQTSRGGSLMRKRCVNWPIRFVVTAWCSRSS